MSHFVENLIKVKRAINKWIKVYKAQTLRKVKETKKKLAVLYLE